MTTTRDVTAARVLEVLDCHAIKFDFPMPNNSGYYYATMILYVFRSDHEWLIAFDEITYNIDQHRFGHLVSAYGNCIGNNGLQDSMKILPEFVVAPDLNGRTDNNFVFSGAIDCILTVATKHTKVHLQPEDYIAAGIGLKSEMPVEAQVVRAIAHKASKSLFATQEEVLRVCARESADLKLLLSLEEWRHPDLLMEKPSDTVSFRLIADAVESNDARLYIPSEPSNTHWSNWPESNS